MMGISTKGRYAVRMMVALADSPARPLSKREIGKAEDISPAYVQQLMRGLMNAGLVRSHRGQAGGFSLARLPEAITVGEVLQAAEGQVEPAPCSDIHNCLRAGACPTRPLWLRAARLLDELFDGTTIADLAVSAAQQNRAAAEGLSLSVIGNSRSSTRP